MASLGVAAVRSLRVRLLVVLGLVLAMVSPLAGVSAAHAGVGTPGAFTSLSPSRLLASRSGTGAPGGAVAARGTVHLQLTGRGGVPASGVSAVVLNVTATAPTKAGFITVYGDGATRPVASN